METRSPIRRDVKTAIRRLQEENLRTQKALQVWPLTLRDIGVVQRCITRPRVEGTWNCDSISTLLSNSTAPKHQVLCSVNPYLLIVNLL
ncbi:hypothetical protein NPIL_515511 [Nephila pilipes]|uniref:Uncharacterized protein n=1 Tax=Nephila pilipes TaxID=299642 RepID=A0A8X6R5P0_NEPPI|nr:hypothetical protein NPIL_515511 [Nephila pilipes]